MSRTAARKAMVALATTGMSMVMVAVTVAPASAGNTSWNDCFGGYTGASWYSSSGVSYASTTRVDGCGYVAALLRYGEAHPTQGRKTSTSDYIVHSRAVYAEGGWHWSRSNGNHVRS